MASAESLHALAIPKSWPFWRTACLAALVAAAIEIALLLTGNKAVLHGTLFDPDCYMHLQRAYRMMSEGLWRALPDPRVNAPYGYSTHWTALFDLMLVAGAEPLRLPGLDAHSALYVWGSAISPLLLMIGLVPFAWGVRPWVSGSSFIWLTVLLFTQPQFAGSFLAGRPDHHSLVMLLLMAQLAWLYAFLGGRAGLRVALAAGVVAGLQMCTSVEALLTVLMAAIVLVVAWALLGRDGLKPFVVYLFGCVVTMAAWTAWQGGLFEPFYDRVSIVHIVALASGMVCFGILVLADRLIGTGKLSRLCACAAAACVSAAVTAWFFPDFFLGPWPHLDPAVVAWHRTISELQPLFPSDASHAAQFLAQFTGPVLALPLVIHQLIRGDDKRFLLVSLVGFVLFGVVALAQMRWSAEVQAAMLLPWALTTERIMKSQAALVLGSLRLPLRSFALAGALLLQVTPAAFAQSAATHKLLAAVGADCPWTQAIEALPQDRPGAIVFTDVWHGPEILWRTNLRVVGAPYEIAPALIDTQRFFSGEEAEAKAIIARREVSLVLICSQETASGFVSELGRGAYPDWLAPAELPHGLSAFRLYRVKSRG
jgi:hypothetical protein